MKTPFLYSTTSEIVLGALLLGLAAGGLAYLGMKLVEDERAGDYIPFTVVGTPETADLNGDGRLEETLFRLDGERYQLQYGWTGNPELVPYRTIHEE